MNFEEYHNGRVGDPAFDYQNPKEQLKKYHEAMAHGCVVCGNCFPSELEILKGKLYCNSCSEGGLRKKGTAGKTEEDGSKSTTKNNAKTVDKPYLNLLDTAKVAKIAASNFPLNELLDIVDFLEGPSEIEHTVKLLNEKIKSEYKESVIKAYRERNSILDLSSLEADIKKSMELGLRSILKLDEIANLLGKVDIKSRTINNSHSWQDLKNDF